MSYCFERLGTDEEFFDKYGYIIRDLVPDLQEHTMQGLRDHFPIYCGGRLQNESWHDKTILASL